MHDFHRLRFSSHRCQRLRGLSLVPLGWLFGFLDASTAFLLGARFRNHSAAAATESLHSGSFVCVRPLQALLDDIISISPIAHALGNHFPLRRTLKPVFESI